VGEPTEKQEDATALDGNADEAIAIAHLENRAS
jgi:hypothetical protein